MRSTKRAWVARRALLLLLTAALAGATACVPTPAPPTTTTTTAPPAPNLFCRILEERKVPGKDGQAAPTRPYVYDIGNNTLVQAVDVSQVGSDCTDPGAKLTFLDGMVIGKDLYLPGLVVNDGPRLPTTAYPQTLAAGAPQSPSLQIASINIELSFAGIRIYGSLRVTMSGVVSTINFDGRLTDLQNFSLSIDTPALSIPGFTTAPIKASGQFVRANGVNSITIDVKAPSLTVGDVSVTNASVNLSATTTTGFAMSLTGKVSTAGSFVSVAASGRFDAKGELVEVSGDLQVNLSGNSGGSQYQLAGTVSLRGSATSLALTFRGSGSFGSDTVALAAADVTIAPNGVVTLDGRFQLGTGSSTSVLEGRLVFDGSQASPTLSAKAGGSFTGVTTAGEIVEIRGSITVTTGPGGTTTTTIDGDLRVGALRGTALATVTQSRNDVTLNLTGSVSADGFAASVTGTLAFSDGDVTSVNLTGSLTQSAQVGAVTASGNIAISGDSKGYRVRINGGVTGPGVNVSGAVDAQLTSTGKLRSLSASVTGQVSGPDYGIGSFTGSLRADATGAVLAGSGQLLGPGVNYGAAAGTLVVEPNGNRVLNLSGQAMVTSGQRAAYSDFSVVNNQITMLRAMLQYPKILIDPEIIWVRFRFGTGGCVNIQVLGATFLIGLQGALPIAANNLGCPVP